VRSADRCVVLVSGEAGIGKSRLVAELERSLEEDPTRRPGIVVRGTCVDVGGGLAYLPLIEMLEEGHRLEGDFAAEAALLRRALGGTTDPAVAADGPSATASRPATFLRLRDLLARAAVERDLIVFIDDLHWADRSTLDVVSFLSRRLVGTGVLLVLAYRSDELNRRHPLKPVLADLVRHATLDHLRLEALSPDEVAEQVTGILRGEPPPATLDRVIGLADGNPFHVEELLALDDGRRLPRSLRQVLDARFDQLDDGSRGVVELAAVIGRQVDAFLLAVAVDAPLASVVNHLRAAVDAWVLASADDGRHYRFRHALFREAVYEDLPPLDRIEAHRAIARALTEHPELGRDAPAVALADRARHWLAAGSEPEAFAALILAAKSAVSATAWAEARSAYESALALWDRVADPVAVAGSTRSGILERASEIAWYEGDARGALALNRRAQSEADVVDDPVRLGRLAYREAGLLDDMGDLAGEGEAAQRAHRLIPADPPTNDRAAALLRLGLYRLRQGLVLEAIGSFEEAIAIAETIGAEDEVAAIRALLAFAWVEVGEVTRPSEAILRLDEDLPGIDEPLAWSFVSTWAPWAWIGMGDYPRAIEYAERLLVDARQRGLDQGVGLWCLAPRALAEFWLGRWDAAESTIAQQDAYTWGLDASVYLRSVAAQIAAGRGDPVRARSLAEEAIEIARPGFPEQAMIARVAAAWVDLLADDPVRAVGHIRDAWTLAAGWHGLVIRSFVLWVGMWSVADLIANPWVRGDRAATRLALSLGDDLSAQIEAASARTSDGLPAGQGPRLTLDIAAAEAARFRRSDDWRMWATLADRFSAIGDLPRHLIARQREAEAVLRDRGDRSTAEAALRAALQTADTIGAPRFHERVLAIGRAARLDPATGTDGTMAEVSESTPWGLSGRELDVLALLAAGWTNRRIGEALFITEKTVSVHVTHITTKLGVSGRTQAALLAVRAGIVAGVGETATSE
jgi:DNA-binding CsgD family transcriptional regulator